MTDIKWHPYEAGIRYCIFVHPRMRKYFGVTRTRVYIYIYVYTHVLVCRFYFFFLPPRFEILVFRLLLYSTAATSKRQKLYSCKPSVPPQAARARAGGGRNIMWTLLGASLENPRIDSKSRLLFSSCARIIVTPELYRRAVISYALLWR